MNHAGINALDAFDDAVNKVLREALKIGEEQATSDKEQMKYRTHTGRPL